MNKIIKFLSLCLVLITAFSCFGIFAFAAGESSLTFVDAGGTYVVSKCVTSAIGEVNIPATYKSKAVTGIAANAFNGAEKITKVTIPASVKSVGASAFENCALLGTVTFAGADCTIGTAAFRYCSSLKTITLPSKLKIIPLEAFAGCSSLGSVTIPSTVTTINKEAFKRCSVLQSVTIPASVTSIGKNAFLDCASVKSFGVASGNTAYKAVSDCLYDYSGKTLIQYPNGKTGTSFSVPSGTKTIADSAFGSNVKLTKITLPSGLEIIEDYAFNQCTALSKITIPSSVTKLGSQSFGGCTSLKEITIPENVASYSGAFYKSGLQSVTIKSGVTKIDEKAFEKCASLKSVTIPSSVTEICMGAFDGCKALESLAVSANVTTIGKNAFINCPNLTLTVKKGSAAYNYAVSNGIEYKLEGGEVEPEKTVTSIAIKSKPTKLSYTAGEKINTSGLALTVKYSDGTTATVTSGFELDKQYAVGSGTKTITVNYMGKTATFTISVKASSKKVLVGLKIKTLPDKLAYNYKDTLSTDGMVLVAEYSDESTKTITSGYTVSETVLKKTGTQNIVVTYEGFTAEYEVEVSYTLIQWIIMIFLLGFLWY